MNTRNKKQISSKTFLPKFVFLIKLLDAPPLVSKSKYKFMVNVQSSPPFNACRNADSGQTSPGIDQKGPTANPTADPTAKPSANSMGNLVRGVNEGLKNGDFYVDTSPVQFTKSQRFGGPFTEKTRQSGEESQESHQEERPDSASVRSSPGIDQESDQGSNQGSADSSRCLSRLTDTLGDWDTNFQHNIYDTSWFQFEPIDLHSRELRKIIQNQYSYDDIKYNRHRSMLHYLHYHCMHENYRFNHSIAFFIHVLELYNQQKGRCSISLQPMLRPGLRIGGKDERFFICIDKTIRAKKVYKIGHIRLVLRWIHQATMGQLSVKEIFCLSPLLHYEYITDNPIEIAKQLGFNPEHLRLPHK